MAWTIRFDKESQKQLGNLDREVARKILNYMEELSTLEDVRSRGKALSGNLAGLWRYRVGDYRVICDIHDASITVYVVEVGHRRTIYR